MGMKIHSNQIREAFIKVAEAEQAVLQAKKELADLYAKSEEAVNARWVVENCKHLAPSDDAIDVIYARLNDAEEKLTDALRHGSLVNARKAIEKCYKANEEAFVILQ
jgi:hypothetical protein